VRTEALQAAQSRYEDKRKSRRLPSIYFSDDEFELFNQALEKSGGTKKELIMKALKCYLGNVL